ncbi:MAG: hypothetical protein R3E66_23360 [bacterium]
MITLLSDIGMLAAGGLEWTPVTYYVLSAIVHFVLILVGFRLLGVDPEQNGVIGSLIAAVIINVAQYFLRDTGVVGAIIIGLGSFAVLAGVTSGEVLKAFFMTVLVIASYGGIGKVVFPRTPLEVDDVGGFTRTVLTGGLEAEPITEKQANDLGKGEGEEEE